MFTFFVFDRKYSFMANLVLTFITICLKWNFVSRLFRIYRIRWWYSFFDQNYSFWTNFVQKIKIFSLCWNLVLRLIRICRTSWWCSLFFIWFFFWPKISFYGKFSYKIQHCLFQVKFGTHNHVHNIFRLFDGWANFCFIASKTKRVFSNKLVYTSYRTT